MLYLSNDEAELLEEHVGRVRRKLATTDATRSKMPAEKFNEMVKLFDGLAARLHSREGYRRKRGRFSDHPTRINQ